MVFRQRNSQRFEMDMSAAEVKRAAWHSLPLLPLPRRAQRLGNPRALPAGRRRQAPLGLPRRRGALHLRRAVQAGQHRACAGAPRAGRRACRRRLCARHRRRRRGPGDLGPRRHECRHRHRHGLHGFDPDGDRHRAGAHAGHRTGRLPGVRHRGHHAPGRQAQLPGQGRARPGADDEEGLPHRPHRPSGPGGGGHPEGRLAEDRALPLPRTVEMRSYNPVKKGHGGQIRKAVQLLLQAKRPYIYTGGGVILGNASAELRNWSTCWAFPAPTR
jgi:hypothetical protein